MAISKNFTFNSPIVGIDSITKGSFTIRYAWNVFSYNYDDEKEPQLARGEFAIESKIKSVDNALFVLAKKEPLRLQGLIGAVNFGGEKRFIKIRSIHNYTIDPDYSETEAIILSVTFEILDNIEYLENLIDYRDWNLLQ